MMDPDAYDGLCVDGPMHGQRHVDVRPFFYCADFAPVMVTPGRGPVNIQPSRRYRYDWQPDRGMWEATDIDEALRSRLQIGRVDHSLIVC